MGLGILGSPTQATANEDPFHNGPRYCEPYYLAWNCSINILGTRNPTFWRLFGLLAVLKRPLFRGCVFFASSNSLPTRSSKWEPRLLGPAFSPCLQHILGTERAKHPIDLCKAQQKSESPSKNKSNVPTREPHQA